MDGNNKIPLQTTATMARSLHSDYMRHNSPQETLKRVLNEPIFNGNCAKSIVQSNKSELYYQLTFPLENCGRMYVLPAPTLPCYSMALPLHFICKLFDLNPHRMPKTHVVPIKQTPWHFLAEQYDVLYVILLPSNISLFNRRDPVIQEGGIESIEWIFVYDNCDADVQLNNPLGCFNKHEDYDGDTNTQSIGKGIESRIEIHYNMSRQMLPLMRLRNIISQNLLSRLMLSLVLDHPEDYPSHEQIFCVNNPSDCHSNDGKRCPGSPFVADDLSAAQISSMYNKKWTRLKSRANCRRADQYDDTELRLLFTLELVRRVDTVLARLDTLVDKYALARARKLFFGNEEYVSIYIFYLSNNLEWLKKRSRDLRHYLINYGGDGLKNHLKKHGVTQERLMALAEDYLHETAQVWRESAYSHTSNCQSLMDNVSRTICALWGDSACTELLNTFNRYAHGNYPHLFMGRDAFSLPCIVNVLSRAKGTFDALLSMQCNLYRRFNEDAKAVPLELTRRHPLALGDREIVSRVSRDKIEHNLQYVDNFVEGSKKIPKYCKQANSKKWALQNIYYYNGHLWMDGEIVVSDMSRFFSLELFGDIDLISAILFSEIDNE